MKILMFFMIFLLIGAFFIISQENLALKKSENVDKFTSLYLGWIERVINNARSLTGYVIKLKWLPEKENSV